MKSWTALALFLYVASQTYSVKGVLFLPPRPKYSTTCYVERGRRRAEGSDWIPICGFLGFTWGSQQCNNVGSCWCVSTVDGTPSNMRMHKRGEVDCFRTDFWCQSNKNEDYRPCSSQCDRTCTNPERPCSTSCTPGGCWWISCTYRCACPPGYLRNSLDVCVAPEECPGYVPPTTTTIATTTTTTTTTSTLATTTTPTVLPSIASAEPLTSVCPGNLIYSRCTGCVVRCADRNNIPYCATECRAQCRCPPLMYLDGDRCVTAEECPTELDSRCDDPSMVYSDCIRCSPTTCQQRYQNVSCSGGCRRGCTCPPETYLFEGRCLLEEQCPPICPETQVWSSCAGCDKLCEERNLLKPCPQICRQQCTCPRGQYLDGQRCVNPDQCPPLPESTTTTNPPSEFTPGRAVRIEPSTSSSTTTTTATTTSTIPLPTASTTASTTTTTPPLTTTTGTTTTTTPPPAPSPTTTVSSTGPPEPTTTTQQVCPENLIFLSCTGCTLRCSDRRDTPTCVTECRAQCTCPSLMFLEGGRCINETDCPEPDSRCDEPSMVFSDCIRCDPTTCEQRYQNISCSGECRQGCTCPPDTYLYEGRCLREDQCPPICPETQVWSSCAGCDPLCEERHLLKPCPQICRQKCTCPLGRYLDGERCVLPNQCPPLPPGVCNVILNEEYRRPSPACDATCSDPTLSCSLLEVTVGRCACRDGHVRNSDGVCIPLDRCSQSDSNEMTVCELQRMLDQQRYSTACDADGHFIKRQCDDEVCFCVNRYSGEKLEGTTRPIEDFDLDCDFLGDCPENMEFYACSTMCPPTCDDRLPRCTKACKIDCRCTGGLIRASATNITCITVEECPDTASPSETRTDESTSCRRTQDKILEQINQGVQDAFIPDCDSNGLYISRQCYNLFNPQCWCVDKNTGEEMKGSRGPLRNYDVDCDNYSVSECNTTLNEVFMACSPKCDSTCDELNRVCPPYPTCEPKCVCPEGNVRNENGKCVDPIMCSPPPPTTPPLPRRRTDTCRSKLNKILEQIKQGVQDAFVPDCDSNGLYISRQCYNLFNPQCWCVDKNTGEEMKGSRGPSNIYNIDCDNYTVSECNITLNEVFMACSPNCDSTCNEQSPECTPDSSCVPRCLCSEGNVRNENGECINPNLCPPPPPPTPARQRIQTGNRCAAERSQLISAASLDAFIPECDDRGFYATMQCYRFVTPVCWCADKMTGVKIEGSERPIGELRRTDCVDRTTEPTDVPPAPPRDLPNPATGTDTPAEG